VKIRILPQRQSNRILRTTGVVYVGRLSRSGIKDNEIELRKIIQLENKEDKLLVAKTLFEVTSQFYLLEPVEGTANKILYVDELAGHE
jgi:hypothetical protein